MSSDVNSSTHSNSGNSLIVQGNQLIEGSYDISLSEMRLLYMALNQVEPLKPMPKKEYVLKARDYQIQYGLDLNNCYKQLRDAADSLARKPIITYEWNEKKKRLDKVQRFWFEELSYSASERNDSDVLVKFSSSVSKYLYELKNEFTAFNIENVVKLDSPFSFRLYSWLCKYRNLNKYKNKNGLISTDPLEIAWMKERVGLINSYPDYRDFKKRVLEPAVVSINANTDLSVTYDQVKTGRWITAIIFHFICDKGGAFSVKPARPRLPRRPKVIKGSDAEGIWARRCIEALNDYRKKLKKYDKDLELSGADLTKLKSYYEIIGDKFNMEKIDTLMTSRKNKNRKNHLHDSRG
ncbi:replication initiation protein [Xenorhabdus sp. 42]|uniref:replication initiation protein n=1 Tax=Xenorhabdus szentirmaii TaxID=290112 RepID=UPI00198A7DBA|nr:MULTISPECIES: replication initiation protein [unclassified Xenorhabdus]MBD2780813.1 replication initiation protein [Xenorhabdus sp. 38]MBD2819747.1 replication initiation protein [Xenorhabdus sp. 42]